MIGSRLILPGSIVNPDLPTYTENTEYDTIAAMAGLQHFLDLSVVLSVSPLSVEDLARDIAYSRRAGYAGNPSIAQVNATDVIDFTAANSEMASDEDVDYSSDFSLVLFIDRDASSSSGSAQTLFAFSADSANNGQTFLAATSNLLTPFSATGGATWTNSITAAIAPGAKCVLTLAYDAATRTLRCWKDGVAAGSAVKGAAMTSGKLYFGRSHLFRLGHLFVFNVDLNDSAHATSKAYAENYLMDKYGI